MFRLLTGNPILLISNPLLNQSRHHAAEASSGRVMLFQDLRHAQASTTLGMFAFRVLGMNRLVPHVAVAETSLQRLWSGEDSNGETNC